MILFLAKTNNERVGTEKFSVSTSHKQPKFGFTSDFIIILCSMFLHRPSSPKLDAIKEKSLKLKPVLKLFKTVDIELRLLI